MAKIELLAKFTQIALPNSHPLLKKVLNYAKKHFSQCHMLSSSLLILNDTECFKKITCLTGFIMPLNARMKRILACIL
ncbi:hypothetical protein HPSA50_0343 [Helicobacter pylori SouthAfrica50]|uniref:Uncharacterized protein n=1 Tax=Helicobacter pylori SouthAfrica50 TaxID=1352357 RepID=T2SBD2_HELPX|nr:hypothetical protein HPSA50_0343 [Helicobacter pylori SouthAfrica50]